MRLTQIEVDEISLVDKAANRLVFPLIKRDLSDDESEANEYLAMAAQAREHARRLGGDIEKGEPMIDNDTWLQYATMAEKVKQHLGALADEYYRTHFQGREDAPNAEALGYPAPDPKIGPMLASARALLDVATQDQHATEEEIGGAIAEARAVATFVSDVCIADARRAAQLRERWDGTDDKD